MALSGTIKQTIQLTNTSTADLSSPTESPITAANWPRWLVTDGTTANKMDIIWHDTRTLAATTSEELDLAGGLTDVFGNVLTFVKVKYIMVSSASANGGSIQVGGAATNAFINWVANATDIINVQPGGAFSLTAPDLAGYAVTTDTGERLKINNTDSSPATYNIVIGGTSA